MQSKSNHIHTIVLGSLDTPPFDKCFESCRRVFSPAVLLLLALRL